MLLTEIVKKWFGVLSRAAVVVEVPMTNEQQAAHLNEQAEQDALAANTIWRAHAALDSVYGKGWSKDHPEIVARFMQALSTQKLASEAAALREILGSGSGAITIGIERT